MNLEFSFSFSNPSFARSLQISTTPPAETKAVQITLTKTGTDTTSLSSNLTASAQPKESGIERLLQDGLELVYQASGINPDSRSITIGDSTDNPTKDALLIHLNSGDRFEIGKNGKVIYKRRDDSKIPQSDISRIEFTLESKLGLANMDGDGVERSETEEALKETAYLFPQFKDELGSGIDELNDM
ncbi:MAG: hypothetical protein SFT81_04935 [Candidatus Caenarcaniphilales bacterium]|nr:hypothetical protein [Candidatus Caenarcaniphilales bacterium]